MDARRAGFQIGMMIDELFSSLTLRKKINEFVDDWLLISDQGDESSTELAAASSGYVFIRRFPKYNEKTMEKHGDLLHLGLVHTLNHSTSPPIDLHLYIPRLSFSEQWQTQQAVLLCMDSRLHDGS